MLHSVLHFHPPVADTKLGSTAVLQSLLSLAQYSYLIYPMQRATYLTFFSTSSMRYHYIICQKKAGSCDSQGF